jgi:hypothetical protein
MLPTIRPADRPADHPASTDMADEFDTNAQA